MKEGWGIPTSGIFSSLTTTELVRWYGMDGLYPLDHLELLRPDMEEATQHE